MRPCVKSVPVARILHDFEEFVDLVHGQRPTTWIYFASLKPTPLRWKQWEKHRRTNQMIEDFCRTKPQVQFIDVSSEMLIDSLLAAQHVLEMCRRALPIGAARLCLDPLSNRLTKIVRKRTNSPHPENGQRLAG